jgi:hypothetical protein
MDRAALIDRYRAAYDAVADALDGATDRELDARPADGGWTARECVHHLADSESISGLRLRQVLVGDDPDIRPYDQDAWAAALPYGLPIDGALAVLRAVRERSLATLLSLGEDDWGKAGRHPEWDEPYTVHKWLEIYAEHPYEHADQIRAALRSTGA